MPDKGRGTRGERGAKERRALPTSFGLIASAGKRGTKAEQLEAIVLLGNHRCTGDLIPHLVSVLHLFAVCRRRPAMAAWVEVLGDRPRRGEEALRMSGGLQPVIPENLKL
jgi:hypothetical protein